MFTEYSLNIIQCYYLLTFCAKAASFIDFLYSFGCIELKLFRIHWGDYSFLGPTKRILSFFCCKLIIQFFQGVKGSKRKKPLEVSKYN